jgi:hypothetical protein
MGKVEFLENTCVSLHCLILGFVEVVLISVGYDDWSDLERLKV